MKTIGQLKRKKERNKTDPVSEQWCRLRVCGHQRAFSFPQLPDSDPSAASSASPHLLPTRYVSLPTPPLLATVISGYR